MLQHGTAAQSARLSSTTRMHTALAQLATAAAGRPCRQCCVQRRLPGRPRGAPNRSLVQADHGPIIGRCQLHRASVWHSRASQQWNSPEAPSLCVSNAHQCTLQEGVQRRESACLLRLRERPVELCTLIELRVGHNAGQLLRRLDLIGAVAASDSLPTRRAKRNAHTRSPGADVAAVRPVPVQMWQG